MDDLTPELEEWIYGPDDQDDDLYDRTAEEYRIAEEEERFRWIPGYRQLVESYLAAVMRWHRSWVRSEPYPDEPDDVRELRARVSEYQKQRATPPWEQGATSEPR